MAYQALCVNSPLRLLAAVRRNYRVQCEEGMIPLPEIPGSHARKYCGAGWGGYALYLFNSAEARDAGLRWASRKGLEALAVEPYLRAGH
jgi:hypothetical protein